MRSKTCSTKAIQSKAKRGAFLISLSSSFLPSSFLRGHFDSSHEISVMRSEGGSDGGERV